MTYAIQEDIIPDPVKPYLRTIPEIPAPNREVLELQIDIREELSSAMQLGNSSNPELTNPSGYLDNIRTLVNDFPLTQWTTEYIIQLLKIIQTTLDNYSTGVSKNS